MSSWPGQLPDLHHSAYTPAYFESNAGATVLLFKASFHILLLDRPSCTLIPEKDKLEMQSF
jgi:hypothetical protein